MRVWIVSQDPPLKALAWFLEKHGQEIAGSTTILDEVADQLAQVQADVVLLNRYTPGSMTVAGLLWKIRTGRPDLRVILLLGDEDPDVKGIKAAAVSAGVYDWFSGGAINTGLVGLIERPRRFADVAGEVPLEAVQGVRPQEPESSPEAGEEPPVKPSRLRLPSISLHSLAGRRGRKGGGVPVPHLVYGILSPSPGAVFRAAQEMGAAWEAAGGDAVAISLDLFSDPWPAGPYSGLKVYETRHDCLRWYGFGSILTQDGLPVLDDMRRDPRWAEQAVRTVREIYRRRADVAAVTILAFGNPWLDPLAGAALLACDILLLAVETGEDTRICAQWRALGESLGLLPARTASLVSRDGWAVTDDVWDVRDGWDKVIGRLLPAGQKEPKGAGA